MESKALLKNNVGVAQLHRGDYTLAASSFMSALDESAFPLTNHTSICYNLGITSNCLSPKTRLNEPPFNLCFTRFYSFYRSLSISL